jgi:hypothetical protein
VLALPLTPNESGIADETAQTLLNALSGRIFRRAGDESGRSFEQAWRSSRGQATLDAATLERLRRDLRQLTSNWADNEEGLRLLRQELLDSIERGLVHDAFVSLDADSRALVRKQLSDLPETEAEMERYRNADALRRSVLRSWAALYYNDGCAGDWFDVYMRAAALRRASVIRDLKRLAGRHFDQVQNHRDAAVHALNTSLRLRLLKAPPRAVIGRKNAATRLRRLFRRSYDERSDPARRSS